MKRAIALVATTMLLLAAPVWSRPGVMQIAGDGPGEIVLGGERNGDGPGEIVLGGSAA